MRTELASTHPADDPITPLTPVAELPELLTPAQVAAKLGVSIGLVRSMVRCGQLTEVRLGRLLRVARSGVEALFAGTAPAHRPQRRRRLS